MRRLSRVLPAGLAAAAAAALFQVTGRSLAGIPLPAELFADRLLPMLPVDAFLSLLGRLGGPIPAKEEAFWGGFAGIVVAAMVAAAAWAWLRSRRRGPRVALAILVALALLTFGGLLPVLSASYVGLPAGPAALVAAGGLLGALALATLVLLVLQPAAEPTDTGRRSLLTAGAALVLLAATGGLAARLFGAGTFGYDGMRLLGGERRPVSPVGEFYVVTKNLVDPDVNAALWRLEVTGAVARSFTMTLDQLRSFPAETREVTLECISNGVGYGLLSNAIWAGPSLKALLERAGPAGGARAVELRGVDGYVHSLPLDRALGGHALVAHSMNGEPLTRRHGAPVRAVVPGAYGEVSAKWLTRITVLDHEEDGYYERQGWRAGFVHTTSVIDRPTGGQVLHVGETAPVRGVAYAGDRGVSRVEVTPDGGRTWSPARIDYARSALAWVLWSWQWTPASPGTAVLATRAFDGAGTMQEAASHGFAPAGATGLHCVEVRVA
jgi:DMSO/TMAO reductase YedYZ molybdopterin-dependent catalytic subunit